jgi:curved DNA-binding protein CbpA
MESSKHELSDLPFPEVLASLNESQATGALRITDPGGTRWIYFVEGELRAATSDREHEKLATWIEQRGLISEEQRAYALLKLDQEEGGGIGRLLVRLGFLAEAELERQLQDLALHIIVQAAAVARSAQLAFDPGNDELPPDNLPHLVTVQVILTVSRGFADHAAMLSSLLPLDQFAHPSRSIDSIVEEFELTPVEAFLLSRLGGACRITDLLASSGLEEELAISALYALKLAGLATTEKTSRARAVRQLRGRAALNAMNLSERERRERDEIIELARAMPQLDHYQALGLEEHASLDQVEEAWTACLKRYSPTRARQRHLVDREDELRTILVRAENAYEVLSSPELRRRYDSIRKASSDQPAQAGDAEPGKRSKARSEIARANVEWADDLAKLGELHLAMQALQAALVNDPQPQIYLRLARLQRKNPLWGGRALESLRQAVRLDPKFVDAWLELADIWRRRGQPERQRKALERALTADPESEAAAEVYRSAFGERALTRFLSSL